MATAKLTMLLDLSNKLFNSKLGKMQKKFNSKMDKMRIKFKGLTDEIPGLGRAFDLVKNPIALAAAGLLAFGTIAAKGVNAAEKFDSAFLPIRQLNLDKSKDQIDGYRSSIRDAAFEMGSNLADSTNAMYDLQSATGLYGDDAITVFKQVGRYSKATGANINDAMNSTTKSMKAFGLGVNDIDALLVSNAKTVQVGITTFDELARVQTEYAGATSAAGQTFDVGNKIFAMFTSISKSSDIAANQTKTFFDGLGAQSNKIKEQLDIDVFGADGKMKDADLLLVEISKKFQNMSDQQITGVINKIGGPEGLRTALAKVKTGAEDMIKTFDAFDSSQFSLADAVKNAEGDFGKMKEIFGNRLEAVFSKIGEKIIPMIAGIFDKLNPVLEWLYKNIDWLLPAFGTFFSVLTVGTVAVWAFNAAVSANPISLMVLAIAALIALVVMAIKHFDTWGSTILFLLGPFGRLISAFILIRRHWDSIVDAFKGDGIVAGLKRIGIVLLDVLMHPIQQLLGWIGDITGWDGAKEAEQQLKDFRTKLDLVTPEEQKAKTDKTDADGNSIYGNDDKKVPGKPDPTKTLGDNITKVTADAKQSRNITITIDALNKGGINLKGSAMQGMSLQDVENWFSEAMMRVVRNAELS